MKRSTLQIVTLLAAALTAGAAFADGDTPDYPKPYASVLSRADVQADAVAALRSGAVARNDYERNQFPQADLLPSHLLREQVVAEAKEARRLGLIVEGEAPVRSPSVREAEQIRLAGLAAVASHLASLLRN